MMSSHRPNRGFTLIEVILVIIIAAILATVAMRSAGEISETTRTEQTKQELESLAQAFTGNPELENDGTRSDFGYVGDVGAMPPNLDALVSNPGGYVTWNGPYIKKSFSQISDDHETDAWGTNYTYAGVNITSTGSGSDIVRKLAKSSDELLYNNSSGSVLDTNGAPPGTSFWDSVEVNLIMPDGSGALTTRSSYVDVDGYFSFDSVPIGNHDLQVVYLPEDDTLKRFVSVLPGSSPYAVYTVGTSDWSATGGGGGGGCTNQTLRPEGVGSATPLMTMGCSANWQCVDEETSDGDGSYLRTSGTSYGTDTYLTTDPVDTAGCTITSVTVCVVARKNVKSANAKAALRTHGTEYEGPQESLTSSYAAYCHEWATNPNTGAAWTWTEIIDLEIGVSLMSVNPSGPARCTQVYATIIVSE